MRLTHKETFDLLFLWNCKWKLAVLSRFFSFEQLRVSHHVEIHIEKWISSIQVGNNFFFF